MPYLSTVLKGFKEVTQIQNNMWSHLIIHFKNGIFNYAFPFTLTEIIKWPIAFFIFPVSLIKSISLTDFLQLGSLHCHF